MYTFCADGDIKEAIKVLDMMKKDNFYLDDGVFNKLVQCHIRFGWVFLDGLPCENVKNYNNF